MIVEHKKIRHLNDFFLTLDNRPEHSPYFYRINRYNEQIRRFIQTYYEAAGKNGVILEGGIANPNKQNLSYYLEIMGTDFQIDHEFFLSNLKKWLPRMNPKQRIQVADAMYCVLTELKQSGKNENMLKNAYIKFMCWLYYRFERIVNRLGENQLPKILYEGQITRHELMLLSILCSSGCDVVLLQYRGDDAYLNLDRESRFSDLWETPEMVSFPRSFSLKQIREDIAAQKRREALYGIPPKIKSCVNTWASGKGLEDILTAPALRGNQADMYYHCFYRINGVEDKAAYLSQLYQFYLAVKGSGRKMLILENQILPPTAEEIARIQRGNFTRAEQVLKKLSENIRCTSNIELQRQMVSSFLILMEELEKQPGITINKLTSRAVYLLCWLCRYQQELFSAWKLPDIACLIYLGGCRNEDEALFLRFLSRLPVDIVILTPDRQNPCCLQDGRLLEIQQEYSLSVTQFPRENTDIRLGTTAYHAERELDSMLYQDSGVYRNQQYKQAMAVTLETMYEEIGILWNQELKFRPNFSVVNQVVYLPVIFAKVSGVKDGAVSLYWSGIKSLITEDVFVIKQAPYLSSNNDNPMKLHAAEFFKNGKLLKEKIKAHPSYPYGFIREEIQDYLLEKLQVLIDRKAIKGTMENGTEYVIAATVLNMNQDIVRMIQRFDFTRKNPKMIYINTTEKMISLEDSILMAYLNIIGFDLLFFVPTGYQTIERYFAMPIVEHQIGEYLYDLRVPDLGVGSSNTRRSWRDKFFKKGRELWH